MAVKPENAGRVAVNKLIPSSIHREKMGTGFSAGTADQWYSGVPYDCWVEYKFLPKPPTRPFRLSLSTLQIKWLNDRYAEGRAVMVILLFPAKHGGWIFQHGEWDGEINPANCEPYTRAELAEFISRSCTDDAFYSAIVRSR